LILQELIMTTKNRFKKLLSLAVVMMALLSLSGTLQAGGLSDVFSINFYYYPWGWTEDQYHKITLEDADQSAGFDIWLTDGWEDIEVPWDPTGPQDPCSITSKQGAEATLTIVDVRNGWARYEVDTGDGTEEMMSAQCYGTEDADGFIEMTVSDIPFSQYDVILYLGAHLDPGIGGDRTGKIVFNGGTEQDITIMEGPFDGTFTEVDSVTPGNYIVYKNVTGAEFTVRMWGNGFNHIGICGLQFGVTDPNLPSVDAGVSMITWSGQKVELDPNIVEAPGSDWTSLTYLWTAEPDDGVVFDPPSADVEDPNVTITTITKPATVTTAVAIANQGFETPVLIDGDYTYDFTNCPGWSNIDVNTAGGVWNPGLPGTAFPGYGGNAPEGQNVAYVNGSGIKQVLTKTFAADTTYTLTVKVGNTDGFDWTGYKVQLLAGVTVIAEDDNTVAIATGTFKTSTVTYDPCDSDSALLGQALQIRLFCLGSGGETDFDDVKLTAVAPVPVPYVVTLTLAVNNEGNPPEKAVRDTMTIDVYDDACEAAIGAGLTTELDPGNFDGNCIKDFRDIAVLVSTWLVDYTSTGPIPKP
jgi:hypothetical protein